jgi:hypothetical protein
MAATNSVIPLTLTSQAQTGLKIPSGQLAGGKFTIAAGETKDLDIDFNACTSIVDTGNGNLVLKPVLGAGEVELSSGINGSIIDITTGKPIVGGTTIVALEQKDASGVDRVMLSTLADAQGNFVLCPVPSGSYDLVVTAMDGLGAFYATTVTTGVQPGTVINNIPLTPQSTLTSGNAAPASLTGTVQTTSLSGGVSETVTLSALQSVASATISVTIPLVQQSLASLNVTTVSNATCQSGFDCINFILAVPAVNPFIGAFNSSGTQYSQASATYMVDGQPVPLADGTLVCSETVQQSNSVAVTPGNTVSVGPLSFTGCS